MNPLSMACQYSALWTKSQDYRPEKSHAILTAFPRTAAQEPTAEKETERDMTATFFWKLFAQTGSIDAYLAYRHLHPAPQPS